MPIDKELARLRKDNYRLRTKIQQLERREEPIAELVKQVQELQKELADVKKKIAEAEKKKETSLTNVQAGNISISNSGSGNMDLTILGGSTRNIMKGESKKFFFQFSTFLKIPQLSKTTHWTLEKRRNPIFATPKAASFKITSASAF